MTKGVDSDPDTKLDPARTFGKARQVTDYEKERLVRNIRSLLVDSSDLETTQEAIVQHFMKSLLEKFKSLDDAYNKYKMIGLCPPPVCPVKITNPRSKEAEVVHIVDYAGMTSDEVKNYDGRWGGEEQLRATERFANPRPRSRNPSTLSEEHSWIWEGNGD